MDRHTGAVCEGTNHLRQSVGMILGTPIGTRVGRRDFGSHIPELIDQPLNAATRLAVIAAGALALLRQEPRIRAQRILFDVTGAGAAELRIIGTRLDGPRPAPVDFTTTLRPARA
ncbi:hypothetical protein ASE67_01490 [Sphingomonas sp. Leaf23]|nr:hypothetical protein ASE67_01490 [Sphingomonas sp. Leaf23]